jgi:hypothetical protein
MRCCHELCIQTHFYEGRLDQWPAIQAVQQMRRKTRPRRWCAGFTTALVLPNMLGRQDEGKKMIDDDDIQEYVRPWMQLTDEEMEQICFVLFDDRYLPKNFKLFARAIEAKLKERNK